MSVTAQIDAFLEKNYGESRAGVVDGGGAALERERFRRFLTDARGNFEAACRSYASHRKWRANNQVEDLFRFLPSFEIVQVAHQAFPSVHCGVDLDGYPVRIQRLGRTLVGVAHNWVSIESTLVFHAWHMEFLARKCLETGAPGFTNILDMDGLSLNHGKLIPYLKRIQEMDNEHYPNLLARTYIVNSPAVFPALWKLVEVFLPQSVKAKVTIVSGSPNAFLAQRIAREVLPVQYGGDNPGMAECGSASSRAASDRHPPEKQALQNLRVWEEGYFRFKQQVVEAKSKFRTSVSVPARTRTVVRWYFRTKSHDIAFAVWSEKHKGSAAAAAEGKASSSSSSGAGGEARGKQLVESSRVDSHKACVHGRRFLYSKHPQTVHFEWNNEFSKHKSKRLKYSIVCSTPQECRDESKQLFTQSQFSFFQEI